MISNEFMTVITKQSIKLIDQLIKTDYLLDNTGKYYSINNITSKIYIYCKDTRTF